MFKHARSRLSVDQFEKFLSNVRKLNARAITIEEALTEAEKICGTVFNLSVSGERLTFSRSFYRIGFEHSIIFDEFKALLLKKGTKGKFLIRFFC